MFTLGVLYISFYLFIFLAILILSFSQLPVYFMTQLSITNFILFIQKYKHQKTAYLWLFFCLTGLPPVGLFFVKFNIFFLILHQAHLITIIVLFFLFFFNMVYYAQLFNFRNFKRPLYHIVNPSMFSVWYSEIPTKTFFSSYNTYSFMLTVVNTLLFLFLSVLFFGDYFLVFSSFINVNNKPKNLINV